MATWDTLTGTDEIIYVRFDGRIPEFVYFPVDTPDGRQHVTVSGNSIYLDFTAGNGPVIGFTKSDPINRDGDGNAVMALLIKDGTNLDALRTLRSQFTSAYKKAVRGDVADVRGAFHKEVADSVGAGPTKNALGRRPNLPTLASKA
jgi:hypothetical protein